MRDFINIVEGALRETLNYETDEEIRNAVQDIIAKVKRFAKDLPITVELMPEIVHGGCHGVVLTDLFADVPGQGVGTLVMKYLIGLSDETGLNIYTDAEGPRSCDYYIKLGFELTKSHHARHQLVYYPPISFDDDD